MPSDAKKKEAAKSRGGGKKNLKQDDDPELNGADENGVNGDEENGDGSADVSSVAALMDEMALAAKHRSCTGVLASHPDSRDVHIHNLSILFHGAELLMDSTLELNVGRRYGLIGLNGCGKSSLLAALAAGEVPIPEHVDAFLLRREMPPSDKTALMAVVEVDDARRRLEKEAEELAHNTDPEAHERLMDVYQRLDDLDATKAEAKAGYILHGLGFTRAMQHTKNYIARFGHGSAKLARQAQSKEKTLKKMVDGGLTDKVSSDKAGNETQEVEVPYLRKMEHADMETEVDAFIAAFKNEQLKTWKPSDVDQTMEIPYPVPAEHVGMEAQNNPSEEDVVSEVRLVEHEVSSYLDQISVYYQKRGNIISKISKYPHIDDYRQLIKEMDENAMVKLQNAVLEMRNHYASLFDIIMKNIDKIKMSRSGSSQNMY